ncbi:hypothetical protein ACHAXS_009621 [Conticribra weissflogii]
MPANRSNGNTTAGTNPGNQSSGGSVGNSSVKSETVNYLLLYEAMVRHQDLEFDATAEHLKLTVERIKFLGRKKRTTSSSGGGGGGGIGNAEPELEDEERESSASGASHEEGMLTFLQMRRCLLRLGYTWNRHVPPNYYSNATGPDGCPPYDDDVSVASVNSSTTLFSGGTGNSGFGMTRDIMATDAQLIMLLTTLVEMEEKHRADRLARLQDGHDDGDGDVEPPAIVQGLLFPEFVQAYKIVIGGMQSLLSIPNPDEPHEQGGGADTAETTAKMCQSLGISSRPESLRALRARSRERTMGLLRLFGPDYHLYRHVSGGYHGESASGIINQAAGESPTGNDGNNNSGKSRDALTPNRSNKKRAIPQVRSSKSKSTSMMAAKDGLLPRLNEEQIRKLVHSKDTALAKILEEHESEMNLMATNMEELRLKELRTQRALKKRRKRTRVGLVVMAIVLLVGGVAVEYHRRETVAREITLGREEERKADEATIRRLNEEIVLLHQKLADAEAAIRYEEDRYEMIKTKSIKTKKELEDVQAKWMVDRAELETCQQNSGEIESGLTKLKERNEELEEEVEWCRERLDSAERSMEAMERAVKKSRELMERNIAGGGNGTMVVPSFDDIASEIGMEDAKTSSSDEGNNTKGVADSDKTSRRGRDGFKKGGAKAAPVKMEMKYNKAFRNAVILRQTYSAFAGMAASFLLQGLVPGLAKVLGMLLLG